MYSFVNYHIYSLLYRNTEQLNSTNVSKINFMQDIRIYIDKLLLVHMYCAYACICMSNKYEACILYVYVTGSAKTRHVRTW